ncbi:MAG: class II glutamine amidotransferase [Rhodospirillales bacterium]|nr:class II glutamine amidotransferase [Rhodospirillales bacterium]
MCRLYGFRANEPTKVECSLVHAQNALMAQSRRDLAGLTHGHGWGAAEHPDGVPLVEKQAWAAYHGERFKKTAARVYARTVVAHVRRATVGPPALVNTHPFVHGVWLFAHNGTVPNFDRLRDRLIEALDPLHRNEIRGTTDSEHVFRYLLTLWERNPGAPLLETLRMGLEQIVAWSREIDREARISLNVLWTDGDRMVGSRLGRTLWYLERDGIVPCEICGKSHVHHDPKQAYRAVEIASEPLTGEDWLNVPDATVFNVDPDLRLRFEPLELTAEMAAKGAPA